MELTLDQALKRGVEAHKAGKVQEADRYYTAIIKSNPKHPDANHNMGVLAVGIGKVTEALPFFKKALDANPNIEQFWLSYIDALIKLNRINEAHAAFDQAKSKGVKGDGFDQIKLKLFQPPPIYDEQTSQYILDKAIKFRENGRYEEAIDFLENRINKFPDDPNLPAILSHCFILKDNLEQGKVYLEKAKSINPEIPSVVRNETRLLLKQKKVDQALIVAQKTNKLFPDDIEGMGILGSCLRIKGDFDEALKYLNKAIKLDPNYAEALMHRGLISLAQEDKVNALSDLEKAHYLKPHIKQIWHLLLSLKMEAKDFKHALSLAEGMVKLDPIDEKALSTIALCYQSLDNYDQAVIFYHKALSIKPDYAQAYNNMGIALNGVIFNKPNRDLQKTIVSLLDEEIYVRPKDIAQAAISLLKLEPNLQKHIQSIDTDAIESPLDVISDLNEFPLLLKLMSVSPLPDLDLEKLLKNLRRSILSNISSLKEASPELISVQSALALQCFTNEYIYNHTEEEENILRSLEAKVKKAFKNNDQPSPQVILALASYKALKEYDWCNLLAVTDNIKDVFDRQVEEPNKEEKLKQDIPILEEITDKVSSKVRGQYEESPYPRWVNTALSREPLPISNVVDQIKLKLDDINITSVENPDILIAGCGTGQHSIGTAARFKSSKVLAIDLSLSSLAYAKRKTEELGIENIEYMQADILDLNKLNKKFDIIESSGVLHHMHNPIVGWRVLTDCLKPGGLMKIGLYSELARENIVKIRKEIKKSGIGSNNIEMISFRDTLVRSDKHHHKQVVAFSDFYSASELRDLLFHIQEHRFTIPIIKEHLAELGIEFRGFESQQIISQFKKTNIAKEDPYDLNKWQVYEEANPSAFAGMYQFWCQKVN